MNDFFKKVAIVVIAVMVSVAANAQMQGEKAIGGNLVYGTGGTYSHTGIGVKYFYNVSDPIRLAGEFDFFPAKNYFSWWDLSMYGHYLFPVADNIMLYPAVGLGMVGVKYAYKSTSSSTSGLALSLGGGADFELSYNLILNLELRYKALDFSELGVSGNRTNLAIGLAYKF